MAVDLPLDSAKIPDQVMQAKIAAVDLPPHEMLVATSIAPVIHHLIGKNRDWKTKYYYLMWAHYQFSYYVI